MGDGQYLCSTRKSYGMLHNCGECDDHLLWRRRLQRSTESGGFQRLLGQVWKWRWRWRNQHPSAPTPGGGWGQMYWVSERNHEKSFRRGDLHVFRTSGYRQGGKMHEDESFWDDHAGLRLHSWDGKYLCSLRKSYGMLHNYDECDDHLLWRRRLQRSTESGGFQRLLGQVCNCASAGCEQ